MECDESIGTIDASEWTDLTLSMDDVLHAAWRWLPAMAAITFLPYLLVWGFAGESEWPGTWTSMSGWVLGFLAAGLIYVVSALVHEAIHLAAMILVGGVSPASLRFGMRLSEGVLYVHSGRPMSAGSYRVVLLAPAVLLGIIPSALGIANGSAWLVLYGFVMLASAVGDVAVLQLIRHLDARTRVRDHPKEIGCQARVSPQSA